MSCEEGGVLSHQIRCSAPTLGLAWAIIVGAAVYGWSGCCAGTQAVRTRPLCTYRGTLDLAFGDLGADLNREGAAKGFAFNSQHQFDWYR
jgi:hypothetical protein